MLKFVLLASGIITAALGFLTLLGWALGLPLLASFGANLVPMAPSTAVLFLLYGVVICLRARTPLSRGTFWVSVTASCLVALVALLFFVLRCLNIQWGVEHLGVNITATVQGVPIGHMSPLTAACFLLASLSFLTSLPPSATRSWRTALALGSAGVLLGTCYVFLLAYLFGTPLLYSGRFIPPSLNTILAFTMLCLALLTLAGRMAGLFGGSPANSSRTVFHFILIFVTLAVGIVTCGYLYYRNQERQYRITVEQQLSAIAKLKVDGLVRWRSERRADAAVFFKNPSFSALMRRFLEKPEDADAQRQLLDWLGKYSATEDYSQVFLLDTQGVRRLSVPTDLNPVCSDTARVAAEVLRSGQIAFEDFNRHSNDENIYLVVMVPIFDESNANRPLGVVGLRIDPVAYLYPFIKRWPTPSPTAETQLLRRDGNDVLYLNDLRFQSTAALNLRIPLERTNVTAVGAVLGQTRIMQGVDYRGVPVIAAARTVPDSPWFLVAKMDAAEMYAPMRERLWQMVVVVGALLLGAGACVGLVWRQQRVQFYRERAEVLRESKERLRLVVDSAHDAFIATDADGVIIDWNPQAETILGWSRAEAVGQIMPDLVIPPQHREGHRHGVAHFLATGEGAVLNKRIEITALHRDGHELPIEIAIAPVRLGNEFIFNAFLHDITERKRAEKELRATNERLQNALDDLKAAQEQVIQHERLRAIGAMASGVAHDFNNSLVAILGCSELLLHLPGCLDDKEKARSYIEMMRTAALDAGKVVDRLREFYRLREDSEVPVPVNINDLVGQVVALTQPKWKAETEVRGVSVDMQTQLQEVPPVAGNAAELREVLTNLIFNAADAMPRGGLITISTRRDDGYVVLEVGDTGTGMTEDVRRRCLEPFFTTKGECGTGLGLSMVYGVIQRHKGTLDITTEVGKGTTFVIRLPAQITQLPSAPKAQPADAGQHLRVLVVDDENAVRTLIGEYLKLDGHIVEAAANGHDGLAKFRNSRFDLVLVDRTMPDMNGDQVATAIKSANPSVPVVMLTGSASMMDDADEKPTGVDFIVGKPVTIDGLRAAVSKAVASAN